MNMFGKIGELLGRGKASNRTEPDIMDGREYVARAKQETALLIANAAKTAAQAADECDPERIAVLYRKWQPADLRAEVAKLILVRAHRQLKAVIDNQESLLDQPFSARIWRIERDPARLFAKLDNVVTTTLQSGRNDLLVNYLKLFDIEQAAIDGVLGRIANSEQVFEEARKKWHTITSSRVTGSRGPTTDVPETRDTHEPASDATPADEANATLVPGAMRSNSTEEAPVHLFYSYSHMDEPFRRQLLTHLSALRRTGVISEWHDKMIRAGEEWNAEIDKHLELAHVIVLLISSDFLASDYCYGVEMERAMQKHSSGEARVVPIIVRPVDFEGVPFAALQALPSGAKPVTEWSNIDEAWTDVAKGLRQVCGQVRRRLNISQSSSRGSV